jgi:hypothetical protein
LEFSGDAPNGAFRLAAGAMTAKSEQQGPVLRFQREETPMTDPIEPSPNEHTPGAPPLEINPDGPPPEIQDPIVPFEDPPVHDPNDERPYDTPLQ